MAAMNPFEIFGLKPQFRIDKQKLDEKYFEIQKKVHPDRFASASDTEKRVAQQWATLINDAFQKLSDPIQRGKALCALRGHLIDEDSSGSISEEFLLEQLERREAISGQLFGGSRQIPNVRYFSRCLSVRARKKLFTRFLHSNAIESRAYQGSITCGLSVYRT